MESNHKLNPERFDRDSVVEKKRSVRDSLISVPDVRHHKQDKEV